MLKAKNVLQVAYLPRYRTFHFENNGRWVVESSCINKNIDLVLDY